jgi:hypothetical protein
LLSCISPGGCGMQAWCKSQAIYMQPYTVCTLSVQAVVDVLVLQSARLQRCKPRQACCSLRDQPCQRNAGQLVSLGCLCVCVIIFLQQVWCLTRLSCPPHCFGWLHPQCTVVYGFQITR